MKMKRVRAAILTAALTLAMTATPVFAAPETDSASLQQQKEAVQGEVDSLQAQLNDLFSKIGDLENQLIAKGQEITAAEQKLQETEALEEEQRKDMMLRIKYMYEEGNTSALENILESGSIAEMLTKAEYVQKVNEYDRNALNEYVETVNEVKRIKTTLEADQKVLQETEADYNEQQQQLSTTLDAKRGEVENLDAMIQEAARKALEEQQRKEQEAASNNGGGAVSNNGGGAASNTGGGSVNPGGGQETTPSQPVTPDPQPETPSEPSYNPSTGNAVVDRAYSQLGAAYVWGACSPGAFDCSGLVSYCLTGSYTRLGTTFTFLTWPQVSNPQPGDVCVNAEHCGIYIGGGQMIHAATEGVGVIIGPVQSGMIYVRY